MYNHIQEEKSTLQYHVLKRKSFQAAEKSAAEPLSKTKKQTEHGLKFRLHFLEALRGGGRGVGGGRGNNPAKLQERDSSSTANNATDTLCVCVYFGSKKKRRIYRWL